MLLGFLPLADVVTLDDGNFHSEVIDSDQMFFVEFYAPWWVLGGGILTRFNSLNLPMCLC